MEPEHLRFGGGVAQTILSPVVILILLLAGVFICFASRNKAVTAFLCAGILIPTDQIFVVGSLHFPTLRLLILFGLLRVFWSKINAGTQIFSGGMTAVDWLIPALTVFVALDGLLLWRQWQALLFQLGNAFTAIGIYVIARFLIRDKEDALRALRTFAFLASIVAVVMVYEQVTGRNPIYGLLGGARASEYGTVQTREDDGRLRATASFGHPILAGTFGAVMLPLFVGLWWKNEGNRKVATIGILSSFVIPVAANSSTSLLGLGAGLLGLCLWPLRKVMRGVRWGVVFVLVSLHLVMRAPVWHLISRIDLTGNSSSYHRYELVNQCILHFTDWWLVGTKSYADWGWDMWDLSNQYVAIGEVSGLVPMLLFISIIALSFKYLGTARKAYEGIAKQEFYVWALGSALFANVVAFFGISYFDQSIVTWYTLLAVFIAVTGEVRAWARSPESTAATLSMPPIATQSPSSY